VQAELAESQREIETLKTELTKTHLNAQTGNKSFYFALFFIIHLYVVIVSITVALPANSSDAKNTQPQDGPPPPA